jgi:uncharacterized protein YjbI with pentapeptide repeats
MIYWLQEATEAGAQGAASSSPGATLTGAVVGAVVGLAGVLITQVLTHRRHSQTIEQTAAAHEETLRHTAELEAQRAHEAALQKYFEQMREALADPKRPLRRSTMGDALSSIARAQTLAVIEGLDPERKRILLQFLYESNLIRVDEPIISLEGANLRGAFLETAWLRGAFLGGANLPNANLKGAFLNGASLQMAILVGANLKGAFLQGANLRGASLDYANLTKTSLQGAYLEGALLGGANLQNAYLEGVYLEGARLAEAKNLTQEQINNADGDKHTQLPDHLHRPAHWRQSSSDGGEE